MYLFSLGTILLLHLLWEFFLSINIKLCLGLSAFVHNSFPHCADELFVSPIQTIPRYIVKCISLRVYPGFPSLISDGILQTWWKNCLRAEVQTPLYFDGRGYLQKYTIFESTSLKKTMTQHTNHGNLPRWLLWCTNVQRMKQIAYLVPGYLWITLWVKEPFSPEKRVGSYWLLVAIHKLLILPAIMLLDFLHVPLMLFSLWWSIARGCRETDRKIR